MEADITLLLEGTYPFVRGGVSGWVHQIIQGLPHIKFSLIFLGAKESDYDSPKYSLPDNVVHLECHYLWEPIALSKPKACAGNKDYVTDAMKLHDWFKNPKNQCSDAIINKVLTTMGQANGFTAEEFFYSDIAWQTICTSHLENCHDESFIAYFWTIRAMHAPLFKLARIAHQLPNTRAFHSVSSGYAGFLGALLANLTGRPFILTEHGIYTKERKIDLQSLFIQEHNDHFGDAPKNGMSYQNRLWIHYFESLGHLTYRYANPIISLYEKNRQRQITDGADAKRTIVIPNGIEPEKFLPLRQQRPKKTPMVVGLLGRIVPIKDIKTFIRSMRTVVIQIPEAEGWLIGPENEDQEYVDECKNLVKSLGLENNIRFLGFQKINNILPSLGLMVLTSISEAFPLVLLEAFASGIPVVTTDVGACREIIEGKSTDDKALGSAGLVVPIADPDATAKAILALLMDKQHWLSAQQAGIQRVEKFYTQTEVLSRYAEIYDQAITS